MTGISVKRVSKDKLDSEIEDKLVEGWKLISRSDNLAIMKKPGKVGSMWLHVPLLFFTAGLGNILYGWYSYSSTKAELHLKVE